MLQILIPLIFKGILFYCQHHHLPAQKSHCNVPLELYLTTCGV